MNRVKSHKRWTGMGQKHRLKAMGRARPNEELVWLLAKNADDSRDIATLNHLGHYRTLRKVREAVNARGRIFYAPCFWERPGFEAIEEIVSVRVQMGYLVEIDLELPEWLDPNSESSSILLKPSLSLFWESSPTRIKTTS